MTSLKIKTLLASLALAASGVASAQNQLRNHIDAEQRRNNRRLRSQREATSNRFLSQRYFQSRERR